MAISKPVSSDLPGQLAHRRVGVGRPHLPDLAAWVAGTGNDPGVGPHEGQGVLVIWDMQSAVVQRAFWPARLAQRLRLGSAHYERGSAAGAGPLNQI